MRSPFPGMDPYLERSWRDVHTQIVTYASAALNGTLPEELISRAEERVVIDQLSPARTRAISPDVRVYEDPDARRRGGAVTLDVPVARPIILEMEQEEHTEAYITIVDPDGELVTVVEFLSPSNKAPGNFACEEYRRKRDSLAAAKVNHVEIDLVRQGDWLGLVMPLFVPTEGNAVYRAIVRRIHPKPQVELYPIPLEQRLPAIPIPLRATDADVKLDLQPLIEQAYRNGRYDRTDYTRECEPPLRGEDAQWANELLVAAGRRQRG